MRPLYIRIKRWIVGKLPEIVALIIYNVTLGGPLSIVIEMTLLEYSGWQWSGIRILDNAIKYLFADKLAKLDDYLRKKMMRHPRDRYRRAIASTLALIIYQTPIYIGTALVFRASFSQVGRAAALFTLSTIPTGWVYDLILNSVRKHFSWKPIEPS